MPLALSAFVSDTHRIPTPPEVDMGAQVHGYFGCRPVPAARARLGLDGGAPHGAHQRRDMLAAHAGAPGLQGGTQAARPKPGRLQMDRIDPAHPGETGRAIPPRVSPRDFFRDSLQGFGWDFVKRSATVQWRKPRRSTSYAPWGINTRNLAPDSLLGAQFIRNNVFDSPPHRLNLVYHGLAT